MGTQMRKNKKKGKKKTKTKQQTEPGIENMNKSTSFPQKANLLATDIRDNTGGIQPPLRQCDRKIKPKWFSILVPG